MPRLRNWIGGRRTPPSGESYQVNCDPRTGVPTVAVALGTAADVDAAAQAAQVAARGWRRTSSLDRGRILYRIGELIRRDLDRLVELEQQDSGKSADGAAAEIRGAADYFAFYASLVHLPVGDVVDVVADQHVYTRREPFGVVGIITPWNLPLNQAARAVAPALAAGNVTIVKPAEATSQSTLALAELGTEAGLPDGVLNVVLGNGAVVGTAVVAHPLVRKVAFTGSVPVGREIGHIAAERILPLTLELGGKSANIVFADADLKRACSEAVRAYTTNAGQVCSAGTRLLVQRPVHDEFVAAVIEASREITVGTRMGPMITEKQYETVRRYFDIAREEGAVAALGGTLPERDDRSGGLYVEPTVYTGIDNSMRIAREEIFGPVLAVIPFDTEEEAIAIANDSEYGLVGAVWTHDMSRAFRVADAIEAGQIYVNTWSTQAVQTSFGGQKNSGYGREKGIEALHHYTQVKSVTIALDRPSERA